MPVSSAEGLYRSDDYLALRTQVSLTAFRIAWQWAEQHMDTIYASAAADLADEADRCADLKELRREQQAPHRPRAGLVSRPRIPARL